MNDKNFTYRISLSQKESARLKVTITDGSCIVDVTPNPSEMPKYDHWSDLSFHQCTNCPLPETVPKCPVAVNLLPVMLSFKCVESWQNASADVECERRHYFSKTAAQNALQSLVGLIMASSGCPHFEFLRPLAQFHLPFASAEETIFRVVSSFVLGEHLETPDAPINLEKLSTSYRSLEVVNQGIITRIRSLHGKDADQNAIINLDTFIKLFSIEYEMNLEELRELYKK